MLHIHLTEEEQHVLENLLESCISDLRMEIAGTDNINYKMMLKGRKMILHKLLDALQHPEHEEAVET